MFQVGLGRWFLDKRQATKSSQQAGGAPLQIGIAPAVGSMNDTRSSLEVAESAAAWPLTGRLYGGWVPRERDPGPISLPRPSVSSVWGSKKVKSKKRTGRLGKGAVQHRDLGLGDHWELPHAPMRGGTSQSQSQSHWVEGFKSVSPV